MKKRVVALVLALALTMGLTSGLAFAADASDTVSGTCGDNLTWVLEDGVLTISGTGAMYYYEDEDSVPWYGERADITSVVIESGVTSISSYAFYGCTSLESVSLPSTLTEIDYCTFDECEYLTDIYYEGSKIELYVIYGNYYYLLEKDSVEVHYVVDDDTIVSSGSCGDNVNYTLTGGGVLTFSGTGEIEIEEDVFWYNGRAGITSVIIEDGITSIGDFVFYACISLENISFPESLTSIGNYAFGACESLESISFPEGLTSVGAFAFASCTSLVSISFPSTLTSIANSAFEECASLTSIEISEDVTSLSIENFAFMNCDSLTSIEIPGGVTYIGNCAFMGCESLTDVEISEGVTSIGLGAFMGCDNLTNIEIPVSVTNIGYGVFGTFNSEGTSIAKNVIFEGDAPELISGDEYSDNGEQMVLSGDSFKGLFGYAFTYMRNVTYEYSDATIYYYSDAEGFTDEYKALLEECANVTWVVLDRESDETESVGSADTGSTDTESDSSDSTDSDSADDSVSTGDGADNSGASSDDSGSASDTSLSVIDSETTASYTLGSGGGATIAVDADIETFVSVTVDGTVLTQDTDYTVTEGSTIITFTESFLETLPEGDHDVVIAFTGGDVQTTLSVEASGSSFDSGNADDTDDAEDSGESEAVDDSGESEAADSNDTGESEDVDDSSAAEVGDASNLVLWTALGLLAALGLIGAGLRKRITG